MYPNNPSFIKIEQFEDEGVKKRDNITIKNIKKLLQL